MVHILIGKSTTRNEKKKKKQNYLLHKENHRNTKEAYTDGLKNIEKKGNTYRLSELYVVHQNQKRKSPDVRYMTS